MKSLVVTILLGVALTLALMGLLSDVPPAHAAPSVHYVSATGDCGGNVPCYDTVQAGVDAAADGDVIKVAAGVYTDVHVRARNDTVATGVVTQVVYISKTVTIQGGYTPTFAGPPDPESNVTALDADGRGRVVYITGDVTATIVGMRIMGGDAAGMAGGGILDYLDTGGGVYATTATVVISNCQVVSNTAYSAAGIYLFSSGPSVLHENVVLHNDAYSYAGGVGLENSSQVTLDGNTIRDNSAASGGGLYADNSDDAVLSGNTVQENRGWYSGGGVYVHESTGISLSNNLILSNTVLDPLMPDQAKGGGISLVSCPTATLDGNVIAGNTAKGDPLYWHSYGGGVYVKDSDGTLLSANIIEGNQVPGIMDSGGGLSIWDSKDIIISGNVISANTATSGGGGLDINGGSQITVSDNHIVSNASQYSTMGSGGGVNIFHASDITLRNNTIYSNAAGYEAGGVILEDIERAELENTIIAGNWVGKRGSGIAVFSSTVSIFHSTLADNCGGDGSGILVELYHYDGAPYASAVTISNTILVSHTVGLTVAQGNRVALDGVLWYGNGTNLDGPGLVTVTHALTGHPAFVAPDACDYHIGPTSAAIDSGIDTGVSTDIDGQVRDPWPDLGADEAMIKALDEWLIYLPVVAR